MWCSNDPIQIWTNDKDLVVIIPNQGSYIFRNYYIENMGIDLQRDLIELNNPFGYSSYYPGLAMAHLNLKITGIPEYSTDWRPVDTIEQLSILELFKLIENRVDQRTEQEKI